MREKIRLHAVVSGRVQGVNFRAYTQREAVELGLTGWVRNLPSGQVEALAEGHPDNVKAFERFLHQGSPSAVVDEVAVEWGEATGEFTGFRVRYY